QAAAGRRLPCFETAHSVQPMGHLSLLQGTGRLTLRSRRHGSRGYASRRYGRIAMKRIGALAGLAIAVLATTAGWQHGGGADQAYPTRTVKFIGPYGAASATDITARLFADRLSTRWGKPVVVENRPGGDGIVSVQAFVSAADDHVLWVGPAGIFTVAPYDHDNLPYDSQRDLLPIASISAVVLAVSVPSAMKIDTIDQLVALARAQPGKLNAAAATGISDFLLFGWIKSMDLQIVKVPYRDIMQAPNDLAESRIQVLATSYAA